MSKKKLLIILGIVVVAILLFALRTGGNKDKSPDSDAKNSDNTLANDFIIALLGVEKVTLDTSLLRSPIFESLIPSGAVIDQNPIRGKRDPFAKQTSNTNLVEVVNPVESSRTVLLGGGETVKLPDTATMKSSKITTNTALITVGGLPSSLALSASIVAGDGSAQFSSNFVYKSGSNEYTLVLSKLTSKTHYVVSVESPDVYSALKVEFDTK